MDTVKIKKNKSLLIFSVLFYAVTGALMIYGTFYDLQVSRALFNPQSKISIFFEAFGEAVAWALWGPMFTVLFVCRHDLNESLEILGRIFPFVKPVADTGSKPYRFFNFLLKVITSVGFFVVSVIGYKKIIENVAKKFVDIPQLGYFALCAVIAAAAVLIVRKIDKKTLNKLETLSLAFFVMSIIIRMCMSLKPISNRVRFREMVAASNGIFDENGLSHGSLDKLVPRTSRSMMAGSDFSAFTRWYIKGDDMGVYNSADSFPSGHTMSAAVTFLLILVTAAKKKLQKYMPFAMLFSSAYVYIMGLTRIVEGAHYLTDVASGALIGYTVFLFTYLLYKKFTERGILPARKF